MTLSVKEEKEKCKWQREMTEWNNRTFKGEMRQKESGVSGGGVGP